MDIKTNEKLNETVKDTLKMRGDNMSLYALKRIEELEQLALCNVSQCNEQLMAMLTSRVLTIQSEPDGIVRETMINNLLIDINCG